MRSRTCLAAVVLVLVTVLTPWRAGADDEPHVDALVAGGAGRMVIGSDGCRGIPLVFRVAGGTSLTQLYLAATVRGWQGARHTADVAVWAPVTAGYVRDSYYWCPRIEGLGTLRLVGVDGGYDAWSPECLEQDPDWGCLREVGAVGGPLTLPATTVVVKQAAKFAWVTVRRAGRDRVVRGRAIQFTLARSRWTTVPRGALVQVQRRPSATAAWTAVRTVRVGRNGSVGTRLRASSPQQYRLVTLPTATTWSAVSPTVTR